MSRTMKSRLIMFLISVFCLVFIVSLSRSIYALWQKGGFVAERERARDEFKLKNRALVEDLQHAQSPEFIEQQARQKLNLQREGEVVVVMPQDLASPQPQTAVEAEPPNWQKWWRLFF